MGKEETRNVISQKEEIIKQNRQLFQTFVSSGKKEITNGFKLVFV